MNAGDLPLVRPQQLHDFFAAAARPAPAQQLGVTVERLLVDADSLAPAPAAAQQLFLQALAETTFWQSGYGAESASLQSEQAVLQVGQASLLTCALLPQRDIHAVSALLEQCEATWRQAAAQAGLKVLALGVAPQAAVAKACSASTICYFDYSDAVTMATMARAALWLQPVVSGLFANSPLQAGQLGTFASHAAAAQLQADRSAPVLHKLILRDGFNFHAYVDYLLAQPLVPAAASGFDFTDFMQGRLPDRPEARPYLKDWLQHLAEHRGALALTPRLTLTGEAVPADLTAGLCALWVGILYDTTARHDWLHLTQHLKAELLLPLLHATTQKALKAAVPASLAPAGFAFSHLVAEALKIAQQGLRRRAIRAAGGGPDESRYLEPLFIMAESAQSPADSLRLRLGLQAAGAPLSAVLL